MGGSSLTSQKAGLRPRLLPSSIGDKDMSFLTITAFAFLAYVVLAVAYLLITDMR